MLKIGHRGAPRNEPENTLRSFKKALSLNVVMIECDAHLTKDGQVVVIHDPTVERTTNGKGKVKGFTLKEIKRLDAGKGEKIPTLEEIVKLVKGKCMLNLDVKDTRVIDKVVEVITKFKFAAKTFISAPRSDTLSKIKKKNKDIGKVLVFYPIRYEWLQRIFNLFMFFILPLTKRIVLHKAKKAQASIISLQKTLATRGIISFSQKHNFKVFVWTVDEKSEIQKFTRRNVDGIYSNYPELL